MTGRMQQHIQTHTRAHTHTRTHTHTHARTHAHAPRGREKALGALLGLTYNTLNQHAFRCALLRAVAQRQRSCSGSGSARCALGVLWSAIVAAFCRRHRRCACQAVRRHRRAPERAGDRRLQGAAMQCNAIAHSAVQSAAPQRAMRAAPRTAHNVPRCSAHPRTGSGRLRPPSCCAFCAAAAATCCMLSCCMLYVACCHAVTAVTSETPCRPRRSR